jgi:steroid 5-alpha reductase family enzyme
MNVQPLLLSVSVISCCVTVLWLVSLRLRDVSIADVWWAPGFALIAWVAPLSGGSDSLRLSLLQVLLSLWAIRLALHIGRRGHGQPEDKRYQEMRSHHDAFWLVSLFKVFWLQGLLQCLISLPIYAAVVSTQPLGVLDYAGLTVGAAGVVIEAIADRQLGRFTRDPANKNAVMDRGLWSWSRHPNYFGNAVLWAGVGLIGLGAGGPLWTLAGPSVMLILLLRVSGVSLLESTIVHRRPEYAAYINRVSAFIPLPPKS